MLVGDDSDSSLLWIASLEVAIASSNHTTDKFYAVSEQNYDEIMKRKFIFCAFLHF
jgi:hypothetical protein